MDSGQCSIMYVLLHFTVGRPSVMMGDKFPAGRDWPQVISAQHYKLCIGIDCSARGVIIYGDYNDRTQWSLCQCHILPCTTDRCFPLFGTLKSLLLCQQCPIHLIVVGRVEFWHNGGIYI